MTPPRATQATAATAHGFSATPVWWWLAANALPPLIVMLLVLAVRSALGPERSVVVAYVTLFLSVAALQGLVLARWRRGQEEGNDAGSARRWTTITLAGMLGAMVLGIGVLFTLDGLGHELVGMLLGWSLAGLVLGGVQAATLGRYVGRGFGAAWTAATVMGWLVGAAAWELVARTALGTWGPLRYVATGFGVPGNVELTITALTLATYGACTAAVLVRSARGVRAYARVP